MRGAWLAVGCMGCNAWFGLGPTQFVASDARPEIDAPGCAGSLFPAPMPLDILSTGYTPSLATPLELWFSKYDGNFLTIYTANRATEQSPFGTPSLASISLGGQEQDPNFTSDGLDVVWMHENRAYKATRPTTGEPFGPSFQVAELAELSISVGLDLSSDGRTLYYVEGGNLYAVTRSERTAPFGSPGPVLATGVLYPTISPDQLELYYSHPAGTIHRQTRSDPALPFDAASDIALFNGDDADLAADARTIVLHQSSTLVYSTRSCP